MSPGLDPPFILDGLNWYWIYIAGSILYEQYYLYTHVSELRVNPSIFIL